MHPLYIALTATDVIAVVSSIGAWAVWLWVLPGDPDEGFPRSFWWWAGAGLLFLTLTSGLILVSRSLEMSRGPVSALPTVIPVVLSATRFGRIWVTRIPVLLALWLLWGAGWRWHHRARLIGGFVLVGLFAIAFTRSETGHPADHGSFRLPVFVDWIHLVAAGLWIGALFSIALFVFPALRRRLADGTSERPAVIFSRLSTLAGVGLGLILVTGIDTAWQQLGSWSAFVTSTYGEVLLVKLGLVLVLVVIGAYNRYVRLPAIRRVCGLPPRSGWDRFVRRRSTAPAPATGPASPSDELNRCYHSVVVESLVGFLVLIAASVLLHGMPPAAMAQVPAGFGVGLGSSSGGSSPGSDPAGRTGAMRMARSRTTFPFGFPGVGRLAGRTVQVVALDRFRFDPSRIAVAPGATVRFVITNRGHLVHEFVIGDLAEQLDHERAMERHPHMKMEDPNGVTVGPGQTRSLVWHFPDRPMTVEYACHEAGHFAAGMMGLIEVGRPLDYRPAGLESLPGGGWRILQRP